MAATLRTANLDQLRKAFPNIKWHGDDDQHTGIFSTDYPGLDEHVTGALALHQIDSDTNGYESMKDAPVYPARLAARHPLAH